MSDVSKNGVYYVPKQTDFGQIKPAYNRYEAKMLTMDKEEIIGYKSGA